MSRYLPTPNIKSMSIYSTRKEFETPTEELNFAKDYNKRTNGVQFNNRFALQFSLIKSSWKSSRSSFDPNENPAKNPITDSTEKEFRSSCRKTQFSDIEHINFEKPSIENEEKWRSSSKYLHNFWTKIKMDFRKVEPKQSKTFYELQKRQLKDTEVKMPIRNPLIGEDVKIRSPAKIRKVLFFFYFFFFFFFFNLNIYFFLWEKKCFWELCIFNIVKF